MRHYNIFWNDTKSCNQKIYALILQSILTTPFIITYIGYSSKETRDTRNSKIVVSSFEPKTILEQVCRLQLRAGNEWLKLDKSVLENVTNFHIFMKMQTKIYKIATKKTISDDWFWSYLWKKILHILILWLL